MKIYHLDAYTPDIFGYSDTEWINYKVNFGPNHVLSRLNQEEKWDCSVHYFTKDRVSKKHIINNLPFLFHPVSFPSLPPRIPLGKDKSIPLYRHQLQFSHKYITFLQKNPPNLIVINITSGLSNYITAYLMKKRNIPYVAHLHGGDYWGLPARHIFMKKASVIIVTSQHERNKISSHFKLPSTKIKIIPVGVDTSKFHKLSSYQTDDIYPKLLYISRIVRTKGLFEVVKTFTTIRQYFPHARLTIVGPVGDKHYFLQIQKYIKQTQLSEAIAYLGPKKNDELPQLYNDADLFIYPSLFKEGNPAVVMESMACGTPVIALKTTRGANEVIIHQKNGILTDLKSMSSDIVSLLKDTSLLKKFSLNSIEIITKHYSFLNTFEKHRQLYKSILECRI